MKTFANGIFGSHVTFLTILFCVFGQPALSQEIKENKQLPIEILNIIQYARPLQPELTADIFLKLATLNKIDDRELTTELLKEAFFLANGSKEKVRRKIIYKSRRILTNRTTFIDRAQKFGFNRLSLQTRIVNEIAKIDPQLSNELFSHITVDDLYAPLTCSDDLAYDPSDLYAGMAEISRRMFSEQDVAENKRLLFLTRFIDKFGSHSQVLPALRMLEQLDLKKDERSYLVSVYSRSLQSIRQEDVSFSQTVNYENSLSELARFSFRLNGEEATYDEYINALRHYIVSNLSAPRCEYNIALETSDKRNRVAKLENVISDNEEMLPVYFENLNKSIFSEKPVSADETKPKSVIRNDHSSKVEANNAFDRIYSETLGKLSSWEDDLPTTDEQKKSYEWQAEFSKMLNMIAEIKPSSSIDEMETFHRKCILYRSMLRIAPNVKLRSQVISSYAALLRDGSIRRESISEWFLEFDDLKQEIAGTQEDKVELFASLRRSNIDAVNLYLDLEELMTRPPQPETEKDDI
jgi:hypothetical protein